MAELCQAMSEKLFKNNRNRKNAMCKDRERLGLLFVKVHLQLTFKLLSQMGSHSLRSVCGVCMCVLRVEEDKAPL